ncbi:hypothetical protein ES676_06675 [Bizionia saleffrena]|uniref:Putative beta-lactamase-inhibitor-like PepSY-like domain-containing protein n=3 Tax=Bizionia TaxID=283785 RepID=A0A8H2LHK1_9FLAO|nr:hypothetical protein ES676_06675 [Bizionia saleffrena]
MDGMNYKVEFDEGSNEHEIWYNTNGDIIRMESEMNATQLPTAVASTLRSKYADYSIDSIEKIESAGNTTYKVEIEEGFFTEKTVVFDAKGNVVSEMND